MTVILTIAGELDIYAGLAIFPTGSTTGAA